MFTLSRVFAAGALAGSLLLAGCAGDASLISKPWGAMRPTANVSKPAKPSQKSASIKPKTGPSDDIPTAASVGLEAPK
jgi:hypothetical protein